jgi:hypothetical protein
VQSDPPAPGPVRRPVGPSVVTPLSRPAAGPGAAVRTAVVWEILSAALAEADRSGSGLDVVDAGGGTGASPSRSPKPGTASPWSTRARTRWPRWPGALPSGGCRDGSSACKAICPSCPSCLRTAAPTCCCATACSRWSTTLRRRCPAPSESCGPEVGSACSREPRRGRARSRAGGPPRRRLVPSPTLPAAGRGGRRRPALHRCGARRAGHLLGLVGRAAARRAVLSDLVPRRSLDGEPGASAALLALERGPVGPAALP